MPDELTPDEAAAVARYQALRARTDLPESSTGNLARQRDHEEALAILEAEQMAAVFAETWPATEQQEAQ